MMIFKVVHVKLVYIKIVYVHNYNFVIPVLVKIELFLDVSVIMDIMKIKMVFVKNVIHHVIHAKILLKIVYHVQEENIEL